MSTSQECRFSFIYPIRNRAGLLKRGLESLEALDYDKDAYEVVIADYLSEDNIIEVVHSFRGRLNIKYACLDYRRYRYHKVFFKYDKCNPVIGQNIAARIASGKFLIFTSPEIVHWSGNLKGLDSVEGLENKFVYGRVTERSEADIFGNTKSPFANLNRVDSPLVLCDWKNKVRSVTQYFIGCIPRDKFWKYGGIDEHYITGIAYEDEDFGNRMDNVDDLTLEYSDKACGVHLTHDRSYQDVAAIESNRVYMEAKKHNGWKHNLVANKTIKPGDLEILIERATLWRY